MTHLKDRLNVARWTPKIGLGVEPVIAGIDKYFNKLADLGHVSQSAGMTILPVSPSRSCMFIGPVEIVAAPIVLSLWSKIGNYIVMFWMVGIGFDLVTTGMFDDLAVRDVEMR